MDKQKEFAKVKCPNCGRFLFEEAIFMGAVRIECKCDALVTFEQMPEFKEEPRIKVKRTTKEEKNEKT